MTVVICLNFGDKIYLASDSLITRIENEKLKPVGYCFKLYEIQNYNVVLGFAGSVYSARDALEKIHDYASSNNLNEETLFEKIPEVLVDTCKQWDTDTKYDLDIMYAGIVPNSQAYAHEKYPGLGVPPKSICGYFSVEGNPRKVTYKRGNAILVPSNPKFMMVSADPRQPLMDSFVIGSGARRIPFPQQFQDMMYRDEELAKNMFSLLLQTFFDELPIEVTGIGGAYQIITIKEQGIEMGIVDPRNHPHGIKVEDKYDAIWITNTQTGEKEIIKSIWDERLPFDFDEFECFL